MCNTSRLASAFPVLGFLIAVCAVVAAAIPAATAGAWSEHGGDARRAVPAITLPGATTGAWSQYRGNERRTGSVFWLHPAWLRAVALRGSVAWRVELGPMIDASPVVGADGTIYVAGPRTTFIPTDQLIAVSPDGKIAWRTLLFVAEEGRVYRLRSTPAVRNDGSLVVAGHYIEPVIENGRLERWHREARVFLVDATGNVLARTEASAVFNGGGLTSPAYDGSADTFYWQIYPLAGAGLLRLDGGFSLSSAGGLTVTVTGGTLEDWLHAACLNFDRHCWFLAEFNPPPVSPAAGTPPPDDPLTPSPALTQCNDAVAAAYETLRVRKTGHRLWQRNINALSTPAIGAGGRAYIPTFGNESGRIEGRDQDGERRFLFEFPRGVMPVGPVALGRGVKDAGDESRVACRPGDGSRDHRYILDADADNVYFIASDEKLYAADYKGRLRWSVPGRFTSPPAVVEFGGGQETVIVASVSGQRGLLHAFRGSDGTELWKVELDSPVFGSPAVAGGRVYVATQTSLFAIE